MLESLPQNELGSGWRTQRGEAHVLRSAPGIVLITFRGFLDTAFHTPVTAEITTALEQTTAPIEIFIDADGLAGYTPEFRTSFTKYFGAQRKRMSHVVVLFSSQIVAMGVTVANLFLGGLLKPLSSRQKFLGLLTEARAKAQ